MISVVKYLLLVLMTVISVYSVVEKGMDMASFRLWWSKRPWRSLAVWAVLVISGLTVFVTASDDHGASKRHAELRGQNNALNNRIGFVQSLLSAATNQVAESQNMLRRANESIALQSRSIGTLVFNLGTSDEGKRRFARCFQDLSRITRRRDNPLVYESLICENGVAVFGFAEAPEEKLREFFFFTEAEINFVLSGTPLEDRFVDNDGKVKVNAKSELAIIAQMIESKLPDWSDDELEREKALAKIDERMKTVLRYAYRATKVNIDWWRVKGTGEVYSRRVSFSYAADPFVEKPCMLDAEIEIPKADMRALFGLSVRDFNSWLIDRLYANGIEPKVRARDVRGLNKRTASRQDNRTFPYQK